MNLQQAFKNRINIIKPYYTKKFAYKLKRLSNSKQLLVLFMPCFIYMLLFRYLPIWGVLIAFKDYKIFKGFMASEWIGFKNFISFFNNPMVYKLIMNTFLLSLYSMLWSFPMPILLALYLNELKGARSKKFLQTVTYLPYFLSTVVVVGMFILFLSPRGFVNIAIELLNKHPIVFFSNSNYFRIIYVVMGIWTGTGWGSIIYIAALSNIDPTFYEAAKIDGATKIQMVTFITIPCILPTVVTMFLLNTGSLLSVGFERIFLMQNPANLSVSEVLSTYVYKQGIKSANMGYATAVDLFNSVVGLILIFMSNWVARSVSEYSLW